MTTIKVKRSSSQGVSPGTTDLELGELAVNTYDGKLFLKKNDGSDSIIEFNPINRDSNNVFSINPGNFSVTNGTNNQIYLGASDGAIEITRAAGGAYIDFKNSIAEDNDVRIAESSGGINITGSTLIDGIATIGGTSVSGGEGGEIQLTMPPTTNLSGTHISLDAQTNSVRFFESGGTNRGATIDLTGCAASASSTIWHSGNDGAGSGLDADTLDGLQASSFLRSDANDITTGEITVSGSSPQIKFSDTTSAADDFWVHVNSNIFYVLTDRDESGAWETPHPLELNNTSSAGTLYGNRILTVADEGSGNGLDADLLDGQHGSHYLDYNNFTNTPTIPTNNNQLTNGAGYITSADGGNAATLDSLDSTSFARVDAASSYTNYANKQRFYSNSALNTASGNQSNLEVYNGTAGNDAFMTFHVGGDFALYFGLDGGTNKLSVGGWSLGANSYQIWHAGNQGSGSGLDADLLDGIQGSAFLRTDGSTVATGLVRFGGGLSIGSDNDVYLYESSAGAFSVRSGSSGSYNYLTFSAAGALTIGGSTVWHAGNDGSGSGLDADLLDGYHSAENGASVNLRTNGSGYLILDNWLRTGNSTGIYTADGAYFYRLGAYWGSRGSSATVSGTQYQTSDGTTRGYVYSNDSNEIGFLNSAGSWMVRVRSNEIRNYLKVTSDGGFRNSNTTTTATSKTLGFGECCTVTASGLTITLPASPNTGDQVQISVGNFTNTTVGRNSQNIMGLAENLTIDVANMGITLVYSGNATQGWRLI
jgi:hypothetical protein